MSRPSAATRQLQIGPYRVRAVPTGVFGLDGGAMFGTVPRVLWEKSNPPDDQNRIEMEARALLLESVDGSRRILVDCGIGADFTEKYGEKLGPKFAEMYSVSGGSGVEKTLQNYGLKPADITDVVLTHLHFDHAGGSTKFENGKLVPMFPNATYYVQRSNLETARTPNLRERASYYAANFEPLEAAGVLKILDGPGEILPGVSVELTDGHTQGQQIVQVTDGKTTLVYCGDLIPTSSHVRLAWVMGYDLHPLQLIEEKRALLTRAAQNDWYLFFEHDPYSDIARVQEAKGDFNVSEKLHLA